MGRREGEGEEGVKDEGGKEKDGLRRVRKWKKVSRKER